MHRTRCDLLHQKRLSREPVMPGHAAYMDTGSCFWTSGERSHFQFASRRRTVLKRESKPMPTSGRDPERIRQAWGCHAPGLFGGERVSMYNPVSVTRRLLKAGFRAVHDKQSLDDVAALLTSGSLRSTSFRGSFGLISITARMATRLPTGEVYARSSEAAAVLERRASVSR